MNKILISIIFAWFIFPVNIKAVPHAVYVVIYAMVPMIYLLKDWKWISLIMGLVIKNRCTFLALLFFLVASVISFVVIIINQSYEFSYIQNLLLAIKNVIVFLFLYRLIQNTYKQDCLEKFMMYYIIACLLYVGSTCVLMVNADFRLNWLNIIDTSEALIDKSLEVSYVSRIGWAGFSAFMYAFKILMGFTFSLFLLEKKKVSIVVSVALIVGAFFYGRIGGFLAFIIFTVYLLRYFIQINGNKILQLLLLMLGISVTLVYFVNDFNNEIFVWFSWASGPVQSFLDGLAYGQISFGGSVDHMYDDMYFMPEEDTLIFGDGAFTNSDGTYYMYTDVGVIRSVLFFGLSGTIMIYLSLIFLALASIKNIVCKNVRAFLVICILISTMIFECKGLIYVLTYGYLFVVWVDLAVGDYRKCV